MKIHRILISLFLFTAFPMLSQTSDESWKVYDDSNLARIDITIAPSALKFIYANSSSDSEHVATIHFVNSWIDETVDSVGFRLRGNTSRNAKKKSFKVEFNSFIKGRKFYGLKDLNLNGEHNDPSIIRSKLTFGHAKKAGLIASRANHIKVYINGVYYGLYISVEQIDDTFLKKNFADFSGNLWKCLYPADLTWLGSDTSKYRLLNNNGTPAYELKTNETIPDFTKLVRLINIANNIPDAAIPDSIEDVFAVPEFLKYLAMHVLVGGWDSYWSLMNNYYLYYDPNKSILRIIPYDEDNAYGIDWFGVNWANADPYGWPKAASGSRPLADKLIANKQYRNLYTHFLDKINSKIFKLSNWESKLDSLKIMITSAAVADSFRTLDFDFTVDHFNNSYVSSGFSYQHVKNGLKQFVNLRSSSITSQLVYQTANPIAYNINFEPKNPGPNDSIKVSVSAFDESGLLSVIIKYTPDNTTTAKIYPMNPAPLTDSYLVEDGDRYTGVIPPLGAFASGKFSIIVTDNSSQSQTYPRRTPIVIKVKDISSHIVVNEFLADNAGYPDAAGEFDDWIELYNPTSKPVNLANMYMTDNPANLKQWRFPAATAALLPGAFLTVWCDNQLTQSGVHASFKLSKSGEYIALVDTNGAAIIDSVTFGAQVTDISYGRLPDGGDVWRSLKPTPSAPNFVTAIKENTEVHTFSLKQNYPNPFNPETMIQYSLAAYGMTTLKVYDIMGKEIKTLVSGYASPGEYSVNFSAKNLSSGIYFAILKTGQAQRSIKLQVLK